MKFSIKVLMPNSSVSVGKNVYVAKADERKAICYSKTQFQVMIYILVRAKDTSGPGRFRDTREVLEEQVFGETKDSRK